jgi:hypothetical protein
MKNVCLLFVSLVLICIACKKEPMPKPIVLPSDVTFHNSQVFLNGVLNTNFKYKFQLNSNAQLLALTMIDSFDLISNVLGFSVTNPFSKIYDFHTGDIGVSDKILTSFRQIVAEDLKGYSYKYLDSDENFFTIEKIDFVEKKVKGRFLVKFERTSKNGNKDLKLPKYLLYQGVFFETFIE